MSMVFGIVAVVVALVGLLATLVNVGYLLMLNSAAKKRGVAGASISDHVRGRLPVAGGATLAAVVALLLTTSGGVMPDILGLVLGAGGGLVAKQSLDATRTRLRSQH